jgi:hypothetical protein
VGQPGRLARLGRPPAEPVGEGVGVGLGEGALERVVTGDAVGQSGEPAEERLLGAPALGDLLPPVSPGDDRAGGDDRAVGERVQLVGGLDPRVG